MGQISWNFFRRRLGLKIDDFIRLNNCATYKDFVGVLVSRNIDPPPEVEVASYFTKTVKELQPSAKKKVIASPVVSKELTDESAPPAPKKTTRKKTISARTRRKVSSSKKTTGSKDAAKSDS